MAEDYSDNALILGLTKSVNYVDTRLIRNSAGKVPISGIIVYGGSGSTINQNATNLFNVAKVLDIPCFLLWDISLDQYETMSKKSLPSGTDDWQIAAIKRVICVGNDLSTKRRVHGILLRFVESYAYSDGNVETQSNFKDIMEHLVSECVSMFSLYTRVVVTKSSIASLVGQPAKEVNEYLYTKNNVCGEASAGLVGTATQVSYDTTPYPTSTYEKPYYYGDRCWVFRYSKNSFYFPGIYADENKTALAVPTWMADVSESDFYKTIHAEGVATYFEKSGTVSDIVCNGTTSTVVTSSTDTDTGTDTDAGTSGSSGSSTGTGSDDTGTSGTTGSSTDSTAIAALQTQMTSVQAQLVEILTCVKDTNEDVKKIINLS
jgi:hypothetical protein